MTNATAAQITPAQVALVKPLNPNWFVNGAFQGDDNDMACLISSVARKMRESGAPLYACYMVEKMAGDSFFHASWEAYEAHHA